MNPLADNGQRRLAMVSAQGMPVTICRCPTNLPSYCFGKEKLSLCLSFFALCSISFSLDARERCRANFLLHLVRDVTSGQDEPSGVEGCHCYTTLEHSDLISISFGNVISFLVGIYCSRLCEMLVNLIDQPVRP